MAEGGMESEDYLRYIAEDSGNVAADGNFSVQVGSVPLHNKWFSTTAQQVQQYVKDIVMVSNTVCSLKGYTAY